MDLRTGTQVDANQADGSQVPGSLVEGRETAPPSTATGTDRSQPTPPHEWPSSQSLAIKNSPFFPLLVALSGTGALAILALCLITIIFMSASGYFSFERRAQAASEGLPRRELDAYYVSVSGKGWRCSVPESWDDVSAQAADSSEAGIVRAFRANEPVGGFYPNVNVYIEPYAGSAESYYRYNLETMQELAEVHRKAQIDALPAFEIEASWRNNETPTRTLQRITTHKGLGYTLTCSASIDTFEDARAICERILSSFIVTGEG